MSFLIDDILRMDSGTRTAPGYCRSVSADVGTASESRILQQTLSNRNTRSNYQRPFNRSISEQYLPNDNRHQAFSSPYSPYSNNCEDYNNSRLYSWLSIIARNQSNPSTIWQSYLSPYHHMSMIYSQYGNHHYSKRKGGQVRFSTNQTELLEKQFGTHKYLSPEDRRVLAHSLKLTDRQVKTWFQNRRAKWRRSNSSCSGSSIERPEISDSDEESPKKID